MAYRMLSRHTTQCQHLVSNVDGSIVLPSIQGVLSPCSQELVHGGKGHHGGDVTRKAALNSVAGSMSSTLLPMSPATAQMHLQHFSEGYKHCSRAFGGESNSGSRAANAAV